MKTWARAGVLLATMAGMAAAWWAFGRAGLASVATVALRLGPGGFVLFCAWALATFVLLGAAWLAAAPGEGAGRLGLFAWARMIREAVSDLLPLSQLGGIVVSARTLVQAGVPVPVTCGSLMADLVTEMASQLALTLLGLALMVSILAGPGSGSGELRPLVIGGMAVMVTIMAGFFLAQRHGLALVGRLAARLVPGSVAGMAEIETARAHVFSRPRRIASAFALNMLAWLATVGGAWLALRLMHAPLSFGRTLSLEVLIFTLRSVAFAVPGAIGFQEAGYTLAAPLLGLPAEAALALSLAKRARDVAIGVPSLLVWQLSEARAVLLRR
ncbi:lysylphosphatidylglycerol synthase domain-containing protein [Sphingomonas bacterium]|uniref:lysylphosphatidylglycerol synthase domain-containing protein n=1 Tax=Sphingomonas bacterium TaxID=1895847 RepID=UPI0015764938|nr:lysylphosphatidylglycerol synthase domain-containing protein [Sphingomonas bacterium]